MALSDLSSAIERAQPAALHAPTQRALDSAARRAALEHDQLGQIVRDLAARYPRLLSPRWPEPRWAHGKVTRHLWLEGEILVWLGGLGAKLVAHKGIGLPEQYMALRQLAFGYRLEPRAYYMQELYRAPLNVTAPPVLGRYETKNWLFKALNRHRRRMRNEQPPYRDLRDKKEFARHCAAHGVPTPPVLLSAADGIVTCHAESADLDRDLFVKLQCGRGARRTVTLQRVGSMLYRDSNGRHRTLNQVMRDLADRSRAAKLIVQPRIVNHPLLSDMAGESLAVVRVITCLDQHDRPVVTHGMFRVLGKLEPAWPTKAEFGSAIVLATGRMGPMAGDKRPLALEWYDRHPVTGAEIAGRTLPHWPAIMAAALYAHRAFPERVVVGWDIALTPEGIIVLEGNTRLDVAFLQRVHRVPIGLSPLAPLLLHHVRALEADLALHADGKEPPPPPPTR
jgi:Sugar-transfer associated ATP-grasp